MSNPEPPESAAATSRLKDLAAEHTGLVIAAAATALLILKVMRVAHVNSRTALALIADAGPLSVMVATLVEHFPTIIFVISCLVVWWLVEAFQDAERLTSSHLAALAAVLIALLLTPWPFVAALAIIGIVRVVQTRTSKRRDRRGRGYYVIVGLIAVILLADSDVWLPAEVFTLADGSELVGYAIEESGWIVILTEEDRAVVRIPDENIKERRPCHVAHEQLQFESEPTLLQIAIRESGELPEPPCPDASELR